MAETESILTPREEREAIQRTLRRGSETAEELIESAIVGLRRLYVGPYLEIEITKPKAALVKMQAKAK